MNASVNHRDCFTRTTYVFSSWVIGLILLKLAAGQAGLRKNVERKGKGKICALRWAEEHTAKKNAPLKRTCSGINRNTEQKHIHSGERKQQAIAVDPPYHWLPITSIVFFEGHGPTTELLIHCWPWWEVTQPPASLITTAHPHTSRGQRVGQNVSTLWAFCCGHFLPNQMVFGSFQRDNNPWPLTRTYRCQNMTLTRCLL